MLAFIIYLAAAILLVISVISFIVGAGALLVFVWTDLLHPFFRFTWNRVIKPAWRWGGGLVQW